VACVVRSLVQTHTQALSCEIRELYLPLPVFRRHPEAKLKDPRISSVVAPNSGVLRLRLRMTTKNKQRSREFLQVLLEAAGLAAVHDVAGSGGEGCLGGAEVNRQGGDFFRRAEALLGDLGLQHGFDGLAAVV